MEPVEINAGTYYLRQLRADDRLDDRPALLEAFADPDMHRFIPQYTIETLEQADDYVTDRADGWRTDRRCTWAIAEPTTGKLVGEVGLKNLDLDARTGEIAVWVHPAERGKSVASTSVQAAMRFGFGALEMTAIDYVCDEANGPSGAVARKCGFELVGPTTSLAGDPSLLWTRSAE